MRRYDTISGIFLLFLSIAICIGSLKLKIGTPTSPYSGFFPFITGIALAIFSILILLESRKLKENTEFWAPGANKKGILLAFLSILFFAILLERIGFILTSLLFFIFICRFVFNLKWITSLLFALFVSFGTYFVLTILLHAPLPQGIIERIF